ncbi:hypothetical protein LMG24235_05941 [Paraburkholderia sabiae]|jgi:hypothetical protein|nr:hypothetical protein LMG24235_05941 [Paraburkholderia sabiae]
MLLRRWLALMRALRQIDIAGNGMESRQPGY